MLESGMRIDQSDVDVPLKNLVRHESMLEKCTEEWIGLFWNKRFMPAPPNLGKFTIKMEAFDLRETLNLMEDTTIRDAETIKWKGKMLPPCWVDPVISESSKDSQMVYDFLATVGVPMNENHPMAEVTRLLSEEIESDEELNNFRFISVDDSHYYSIIEATGVCYKSSIRDESTNFTQDKARH